MKINYYVINLDASTERLEHTAYQLSVAHINFTRVAAVDGRDFDVPSLEYYDAPQTLRYMGRQLNGGEVGCYLSHVKAVKAFLHSDAEYAVVMEDDLNIVKDIDGYIENTLSFLQKNNVDWHLINIGTTRNKTSTHLHPINSEHSLYHAHYFPMGAMGLVWNRQGAEEFIQQNESKIFCAVDDFFRYWLSRNDKGLSIFPAVVSHRKIASDIDMKIFRNADSSVNKMKQALSKLIRYQKSRFYGIKHKYGKQR